VASNLTLIAQVALFANAALGIDYAALAVVRPAVVNLPVVSETLGLH